MSVRVRPVIPIVGATALLLASALGAGPAQAATFTVDSTADAPDVNPGNGQCVAALPPPTPPKCTLRAAIMEANALAGADTISVPAGTYTLTIAGQGEDDGATGDLDVKEGLSIAGAGASSTIIDAKSIDRVFHVLDPARLTISGATVRNGNPGNGSGGGIRNSGTLTIARSTIANNSAEGILNAQSGTLRIDRSIIANNSDWGIFNLGSLRILASTIHDNAGGVRNHGVDGHLTAIGITIRGNGGSGLTTTGPSASATLNNSTISGHVGEGIHIQGPQAVELTNVTISGNSAGGTSKSSSGTLTLKNTIVANNPGGDCAGGVTASSYSLDSGATCGLSGAGDQSNTDPLLGPLANNGGPTRTHALLSGSPAIDTGDPATPPGGCLPVDQRGSPRQDIADIGTPGTQCDKGAFEFQP
jgi:CSLREA domain-containing protein